ncbi:hypothetical protein LOC67_03890 [Stieleria sp. JC731]|uniref:hypothetical protein n=1 Tax=Pirellulaceae TaxID=2691357 RepID=UPI001E4501D1|nr:hypothetical protein [Stieleria sp. JC731]MCC9599692.1 hypothetical protein [Stieleria sp. JC731]
MTKILKTEATTGPPSLTQLAISAFIVVVAVVAMRWPSGGESFWLDELHSAWAVAADFPDISARAADGNQTTGYFHSLWIWKKTVDLLGLANLLGFEWAMRISSVVLNAIAALVLLFGVTRSSGRLGGGLAAALLLAFDQHAVFFGGELRSYAAVMLCSAFATASMMKMLQTAKGSHEIAGQDNKVDRALTGPSDDEVTVQVGVGRLSMTFWICLAGLLHPTSLGTLGLLFPVGLILTWRMRRLKVWSGDLGVLTFGLLTSLLLAASSLPHSWQRRDLWRAFGQATRSKQLLDAWDWWSLLLFPGITLVLCVVICRFVAGRPNAASSQHKSAIMKPASADCFWWIPGLISATATAVFFIASYADIVPLWHRRYFIAALPMLAWTGGELTAKLIDRAFAISRQSSFQRVVPIAILMVVIGFQLWHQGVLTKLAAGHLPMQLRGERWRSAVEMIQQESTTSDFVWLDSGLIEASLLTEAPVSWPAEDERFWDYLKFPVQGPYRIDEVKLVSSRSPIESLSLLVDQLPDEQARVWLLSRSGRGNVLALIERLGQVRKLKYRWRFKARPSVLEIDFAAIDGESAASLDGH